MDRIFRCLFGTIRSYPETAVVVILIHIRAHLARDSVTPGSSRERVGKLDPLRMCEC